MKNKFLKTTLVLLSSVAIFYSCQKDAAKNEANILINLNEPHTAVIYFTDHQTPVFDSVFIDMQRLEVKLEDDSLPNSGWVNMNIRPGIINILRFRNGLDTLLATGTLPNARLKKIKLILGIQNSVMKNGQSFPLKIKDEDREVIVSLDINNFEIINGGSVMFWIDFDAGNSIRVDNSGSGNNNGYRLKSHIKIFSHSNSGRIEGKVLPLAADPIIKAVIGTDTATAIPDDDDGEFKIVGLTAGTYKVIIDGQNGYSDTLIQNVIVSKREDSHLPLIRLRR